MIHLKRVRKAYHYSALLVLALTLVTCSEEIERQDDLTPEESLKKGVYISGVGRNKDGNPVATYWINDEPVNLAAYHPNGVVYNSAAFGMTLSGNDLYVCGVLYTSQGDFAVYWKNGVPVMLTPGNAQASAIAVVGDDVYITGAVAIGNGYSHGVLWKNGVASYLTEGTNYSSATSIIVSGGNVYVGGNIVEDNKTYATYWKNGTPHVLTPGEAFAYVQTLALDGEAIYAAGPDPTESGTYTSKYWKNGQVVNLTDGPSDAEVIAICVRGGDVYVAGKRQLQIGVRWELVVWKNNNVISTTPMDVFDLEIAAIATAQDDVIVTGGIAFSHGNSSGHGDAVVWTNGEALTLPQGSDGVNGYGATSIVVND